MALINREYHPSPPKEEPKWWEVREQLRTTLESRGWEPDQIQRWLGKNVEEFQRMNELREEAGMEPVSGAYAVPHMLGKLDVGLGATSLPAFTKTLGQAALPYAAMMGESALATTDLGRGMKEWPEDQPKDWRYALMAAGLPLAVLSGGMATRQFASKIPPAPTPKGVQTLKQGEVDEMRRKILQGTVAGGALATIPAAGLRTLSKVGPTAAKVAGTVTPAAGKSFMELMGTNLAKPNIGRKLSESVDEYVYRRVPSAKDHETSLPITKKLYPSYNKSDTDAIKVFIDDNYNVTTTFKDLQKEAKSQAFGQETIHRHLADQANIIDIEAVAHTGKKHFKNYGLKPDEISIFSEGDFDGFVPRKDFTTDPGTEWTKTHQSTTDPAKEMIFYDSVDFEDYIKQHGRKINKDVDPGIASEAGDMGFVGITYYEVDGVPIAIGRYSYDMGNYTDAIIMPNRKGMNRLTGMSEEEIGLIIQKLGKPKKASVTTLGEVSMSKEEIANASAKAEKDMERLLGDYEGYTPIKK